MFEALGNDLLHDCQRKNTLMDCRIALKHFKSMAIIPSLTSLLHDTLKSMIISFCALRQRSSNKMRVLAKIICATISFHNNQCVVT